MHLSQTDSILYQISYFGSKILQINAKSSEILSFFLSPNVGLFDSPQAFRKGSSIVPDLSRAILNLTESNRMTEMEKRCFGDQGTRPNDNNNPFSSKSLDFVNFWGLFLVTGIASTICLIICVASFLYKNRGFLNSVAAEESSIKRRVQSVVKLYDKRL